MNKKNTIPQLLQVSHICFLMDPVIGKSSDSLMAANIIKESICCTVCKIDFNHN
ncbi:MAG: hypothetical protein ACRCZY_01745 [Phocaeicola sp.]